MKNKQLISFLVGGETPPVTLKNEVQRDIILGFHASSILLRFLSFQLLGALISLSFCPQFGLGLVSGHGITHVFRMIGDWACAAFCGSLFLSAGMLMAFVGMKMEELWWVWRRYKFSLIILPSLFWFCLMLTNFELRFESEDLSYHLVWISAAIFAQIFFLKLASVFGRYKYLPKLKN
jgi:hypothetical protein